MRIDAAFPSQYLKAADLQGKDVTVVMDRVEMEEVNEGGEPQPVLYFQGKKKRLPLNKTNSNMIAEMYGFETDDWHSKPLTLYPARVEFKSKIVDAIRVRLVDGRQNGAANGAAASLVQQNLLQPQQSVAQPSQQSQKPPINSRTLPPFVDDEIPF